MPRKKGRGGRARPHPEVLRLSYLPPETLLYIFSFLEPRELVSCMLVAMEWFIYASDDSLWLAIYKHYFPHEPRGKTDYIKECKRLFLFPPVLEPDQIWMATERKATCGLSFMKHAYPIMDVTAWRQQARKIDDPMFLWAGKDCFYLQSFQLGSTIAKYYITKLEVCQRNGDIFTLMNHPPPKTVKTGVYCVKMYTSVGLFAGASTLHGFCIDNEEYFTALEKLKTAAQESFCRRHKVIDCLVCGVLGDHFDQEDKVKEWSRERRDEIAKVDTRVRKLGTLIVERYSPTDMKREDKTKRN